MSRPPARRYGLFSSGVAYANNAAFVYTTSSGLTPYVIDYANFSGEGRELFGAGKSYIYYLKDHLGSTRGALAWDNMSALMKATAYLPYGTHLSIKSATGDEVTREKFTGKELDNDGEGTDATDAGNTAPGAVGLFGARYYDAMVGKWVSVDPQYQYHDVYNYCGDNSIKNTNPDGRQDDDGDDESESTAPARGSQGPMGPIPVGRACNFNDLINSFKPNPDGSGVPVGRSGPAAVILNSVAQLGDIIGDAVKDKNDAKQTFLQAPGATSADVPATNLSSQLSMFVANVNFQAALVNWQASQNNNAAVPSDATKVRITN